MTNISTDWLKYVPGANGVNGTTNSIKGNKTENTPNLFGGRGAGETTDVDVDAAADEFAQAAENVGKTESTQATQSTSNLTAEEVEDLKDELDANKQRMEAVKEEIEKLSEEAAEIIAEALASQEAAVAEAKEESQKVIDEKLQEYIKANQNGEEGMTREQLQSNIAGALPDSPSLTKTLGQILEANEMLSDIDGLLGELKCLLTTSADLAEQIDGAGAAAQEGNKCCDPIGFVSNNVEYNFFTDKDGDGALSQTNEFLGAENQWAEMQAADGDKDGTVTAAELETAGIQLAGTDGSVISGADAFTQAFGANFSIDLNSYAEGGSHSAVDTTADFDADGVMDQQLLGTFNVNVNDSTIQGYNTLDDVDWLNSKYGVAISGETADVENATSGLLDTSNLGDLQAMGEFYNTALQKNQMMRQQLEGVEEAIGFDTEAVDAYKDVLASKAQVKAKDFVDSVEITPRERETSSTGSGTTGSTLPADFAAKLDAELGEGFSAGIAKLAQKYGCSETDLIGLMYSECGLNPNLVNEIGATGLIQFIPETAQSLGTSTEALANMSAVEQLEYVDKFLGQYLEEGGNYSGGDLYATIFLPAYRDQDILTSSGDGTGYYDANAGLDVDGNGDISKADLDKRIANKYQEALADFM